MPVPGPRPCPLCGATDHRPVPKHARDHLVRCGQCTMVFTGLLPNEAELMEYYGSYPVHEHLSPVTLKRYDELLDRFEPYRRTGRIIDVGCGAGIFLERAALRGWEVYGTEYGERALQACRSRNIRIQEGPLDPEHYEAGAFDVVCSFEVIEHLPHPMAELQRMARILRPGGLLYVTTPNYRCMGHVLAGSDWSVVNYPEHLNYFTPRTLRQMLRAEGFAPAWVDTTGVSLFRIRSGRKTTREQKKSAQSSQEVLRERLEGNPLLNLAKRTADATLNLLGIGDSMKSGSVRKVQ